MKYTPVKKRKVQCVKCPTVFETTSSNKKTCSPICARELALDTMKKNERKSRKGMPISKPVIKPEFTKRGKISYAGYASL